MMLLRNSFVVSIITAIICAFSLYVQWRYRIALGDTTLLLTWVGAVLMLLSMLFFVQDWVEDWLGETHRFVIALEKIHKLFLVFVAVYATYGGLLIINGQADNPSQKHLATVAQQGRAITFTNDFHVYAWVRLKFDHPETSDITTLLSWPEETKLWPGQKVEIQQQTGLLGLPRIISITRDEEFMYKNVLKIAPTATLAITGLMNIYAVRGDAASDALTIEMAKQYIAATNKTDAVWNTASDLFQRHRLNQSLPLFKLALDHSPTLDNTISYGWVLSKLGRGKEGIPYLEKAIEMDSVSEMGYYHLAYAQVALGQKEGAIINFKEVLKRRPNYPEIRGQLRSLGVTE